MHIEQCNIEQIDIYNIYIYIERCNMKLISVSDNVIYNKQFSNNVLKLKCSTSLKLERCTKI